MKLPRFVHKLYAILFGYFWDSCPVCGKYFGGHEKRGVLKVTNTRRCIICHML